MADTSYLPQSADNLALIELAAEQHQPSRTYKLDTENGCICGMTDALDSIKQAVYMILGTERYAYLIYSWSYGVELADLIGRPKDYVFAEIKRRIEDALLQDERITGIDIVTLKSKKSAVRVCFTVHSIFGDLEVKTDVRI